MLTGHRKYATDAAQEFVRDRLNKAGQDRIVFSVTLNQMAE